ncbi:MAG: hypothetical protein ABI835_02085 [Chloroflexota bacterium]
MERIPAASNLFIEVEPQRWRLLSNSSGDESVLVEATPGAPLRYDQSFGSRRQLPESGILAREDIQRVVLGWSSKDDAWHLGLVLGGSLVTERGSRWCGLAHWHDPQTSQYEKIATQAGQLLAEQVNRPFSVIPPQERPGTSTAHTAADTGYYAAPVQAQAPVRAQTPPTEYAPAPAYPSMPEAAAVYEMPVPLVPIPQPALPLRFELWTLKQADPARIELSLSKSWGRGRLMRTGWNVVWLAVFIILTVTTLTAGIAYPRPEILVALGIASSIFLVLVILYNLFTVLTATNRVIFEPEGVRWMRGKRVKRAIPVDQIAEIYVSQVISKVGRRGKSAEQRGIHFGEITLFLLDGEFKSILTQNQFDETIPVTDDPLNEEAVISLTEYNAHTRLQAAGLRIARTLHLPAEYDKRLK